MGKYKTHQGDYDVLRGGPCVELFDEKDRCLAGVYRIDDEHRVEIETYRKRVSGEGMAWLCWRAWGVLDPFPDGTPLAEAKMPAWFRKFERPAHQKAAAAKQRAYYAKRKAEGTWGKRLRGGARGTRQREKGSSGS